MQYCDAAVLESHWFDWLVAKDTPMLEPYRNSGHLWTKVIGTIRTTTGKVLLDPSYPERHHCIAIGKGIHCQTQYGELVRSYTNTPSGEKDVRLPLEYSLKRQYKLIGIGDMETDSLKADGYVLQKPTTESWHCLLAEISKICDGISKRFKLPTDERREELAFDARFQVIKKLSAGKLVYTPGKASVFNLLTTTIYRCMYSSLNKTNKQQHNLNKFIEGVASGAIRTNSQTMWYHKHMSPKQKIANQH